MRSLLLFSYLLLCLCLPGVAQQQTESEAAEVKKHLVYFTDKTGSPYSIQSPLQYLSAKAVARRARQNIPVINRDLPVNPAYVNGLKEAGATVWYTSRWFNAAIIEATPEVLTRINNLSFVRSQQPLNRKGQLSTNPVEKKNSVESASAGTLYTDTREDYGRTFHQANMLGVVDLHAAGFKGEGMTIAVLDAGFPGVNTIPAFSHLFENNQIQGTFDFVQNQTNVFAASNHGTAVLSTMAAYKPGTIIGTAYKASYLLLRTEDSATEHNIEEINWLLAAEYADSAGADVINSSLGYHTFDAPSVSYTYEQMDGNTALVSKAADYAAAAGILVVNSAGNDGAKAWHYIAAPADADSVLTVGAVDSLGIKASFSSFGPTADSRIKPDVVALGLNAYVLNTTGILVKSNGTSFSGPITAGFATALWQANYTKSNYEILELIRQLGSKAKNPDNSIGYGIPNYNRSVNALQQDKNDQQLLVINPVKNNAVTLLLGNKWLRKSVKIHVFDITGKLVWQESVQDAQPRHILSMDAEYLNKGMYLCRIQSGELNATVRFVKL